MQNPVNALLLGKHQCAWCNNTVETVRDVNNDELVDIYHRPPCFSYMSKSGKTAIVEHVDGTIGQNPEFRGDD